MKTTITNTIKILLAVSLVIAAQQYNLAMRHQVDDVAVAFAKMGRHLAEEGKSWPETETAVREHLSSIK